MNIGGASALYTLEGKTVWVAGHQGMVGSAIVRRLASESCEVLTASHAELDLCRQDDTEAWLNTYKPDVVIVAAATVGGILANNSRPAEFIRNNLAIETNVIHGAYEAGVKKLLLLGSSCIYPKYSEQPIVEEALLSGPLEPTNEWYAVAKIAGIKLCQAYRKQYGCDFISAQPTNLYGPCDNFDLAEGHVLPALMVKAHEAKVGGAATMDVWGSGQPRREFLYVDDLADALIFLVANYSDALQINIGSGQELTIRELAETVSEIVEYNGELVFDSSKPDGTPRKLLDTNRLNKLGWQSNTDFKDGLRMTYQWYLDNRRKSRGSV